MNRTEAITVLDELKVSFPDWERWVRSLPNKNACLRAWCEALETQSLPHVNSIIQQWRSGRLECPQTYDYERLIYILVSSARHLRNAEYAKEESRVAVKSWHEESKEAESRRKQYNPIRVRGLGWASTKFAEAVEEIVKTSGRPRSQWTPDDRAAYDAIAKKIIDEYSRNNQV